LRISNAITRHHDFQVPPTTISFTTLSQSQPWHTTSTATQTFWIILSLLVISSLANFIYIIDIWYIRPRQRHDKVVLFNFILFALLIAGFGVLWGTGHSDILKTHEIMLGVVLDVLMT
jgi:hypothetical protein